MHLQVLVAVGILLLYLVASGGCYKSAERRKSGFAAMNCAFSSRHSELLSGKNYDCVFLWKFRKTA